MELESRKQNSLKYLIKDYFYKDLSVVKYLW